MKSNSTAKPAFLDAKDKLRPVVTKQSPGKIAEVRPILTNMKTDHVRRLFEFQQSDVKLDKKHERIDENFPAAQCELSTNRNNWNGIKHFEEPRPMKEFVNQLNPVAKKGNEQVKNSHVHFHVIKAPQPQVGSQISPKNPDTHSSSPVIARKNLLEEIHSFNQDQLKVTQQISIYLNLLASFY